VPKTLTTKGLASFFGGVAPTQNLRAIIYNGKWVNFTYQDKLSNAGKSGFFVHYMQKQQSGKFQ
jgi:hypothetical protein